MPDELTIAALRTLADLKHRGAIPTVRPCCGQDYCICPDAPHQASLRDHAADPAAFDRVLHAAQPTRLHVVTPGPRPQLCDGTMTCCCQRCVADRAGIAAKGAGPAAFRVLRRAA